jgi:hypothetical protein
LLTNVCYICNVLDSTTRLGFLALMTSAKRY